MNSKNIPIENSNLHRRVWTRENVLEWDEKETFQGRKINPLISCVKSKRGMCEEIKKNHDKIRAHPNKAYYLLWAQKGYRIGYIINGLLYGGDFDVTMD